jgi:hypothetical protein
MSESVFEKNFGGLVREYLMGYCVYHFFINVGTVCYIIRVKSPDGSQYVSDATVIGKASNSKSGGTGIRSLDSIAYFNILCIPSLLIDKRRILGHTRKI